MGYFNFSKEKKEEYWNHFIQLKKYHGYGVTQKRLEKIKPIIFDDVDFWSDILSRHGGNNSTPEQMLEESLTRYQHCFGNMAGMTYQALIEKKIIKP